MSEERGRIAAADGTELAYARRAGAGPVVVFLPGFRSDMEGTKALALDAWAARNGRAMLRFDYAGHGASGGWFEDGTIGRWADDAATAFDRLSEGPAVLVGSSMGGWIALLLALRRPERVAGLVGIAAAPDFTETLIWPELSFEQRAALMTEGRILLPSEYGDPTPVTRALIEDGRRHLLLDAPIGLHCPVRLLHGQRDPDVPWQVSLLLAERIAGDDVRLHLVKDGDHRLSRPSDLALLETVVAELAA
jgi:pimeloyl-ACP methyl ester carboxylesterase